MAKSISKFLKECGKSEERRGLERIPGTNRVRTYVGNPNIYSQESDLERIISKKHYTTGVKKKL